MLSTQYKLDEMCSVHNTNWMKYAQYTIQTGLNMLSTQYKLDQICSVYNTNWMKYAQYTIQTG